jgi:hypothetical protein
VKMFDLERFLQGHANYKLIKTSASVNKLLPFYLKWAEGASPHDDQRNQGKEIQKMVGKIDLSSVSVIYHEKWEIMNYLSDGFSEEDVKSGVAHKKGYRKAHVRAEALELNLLQHVAKETIGREIPLYVLAAARPMIELFAENLEEDVEDVMNRYIRIQTKSNWSTVEKEYIPIELDEADVRLTFYMFEMFGSSCGFEFKAETMQIVKNFIDKKNQAYKSGQLPS